MGKRSRGRTQAAKPSGGAPAGRTSSGLPQRPKLAPKAPKPARGKLDPVRRTLAAYLFGALVLAVLTLVGIVALGGSLGPFITLAVVVLSAGLLFRAATAKLAGASLTNEDRVIQTMAGGMLFLSAILAAAGALVSLVA